MKVTVLIPAFNEENNIQHTLKGLEDFQNTYCKDKQIQLDVFVIDDGSRDQTHIKAAETGARVLRLRDNKGKGAALQEGLNNSDGDVIVFLDADLRESSREVYKLVLPILKMKPMW